MIAAKAILRATHLLVTAGAGMSADSGLPTYDKIADNMAYKSRDLNYADLCRPQLLRSDACLALGFWGSCFNLYKTTRPHDGYHILKEWCAMNKDSYVYTSNVDGHFLAAGFNEQRICEVHGRVSKWISLTKDDEDITMLPDGHRFRVDETDMRLLGDEQDTESLRAAGVPVDKHGNMMRPAVLMFDDEPELLLKHLKVDQDKYQVWEAQMEEELVNNELSRLVILEIGCGQRVPCVRQESECVLDDVARRMGLEESGNPSWYDSDCSIPRALLIRINPDFPSNHQNPHLTLPVQGPALASLIGINDYLMNLMNDQGRISSSEI